MATEQHHSSPLAVAYARSLIDLATEQKKAEEIGQELSQLSEIIASEPVFQTLLASPAVGEAERAAVIDRVFRGRISPLLMQFMGVANTKGRLGLIQQVAAAYSDLLDEQLGKVEVDVTVAQKLTADQLEQVRQRVSAALKRDAVVHQYVDESIIGGLVLRVQDRLLDASVRAQLMSLRRQLLEARPK